ncbi:hypothetical protein CONLIGDRAFT_242776 [Coniochaeta ligniaria NRRL 30616]|uniref:Uncharacterized protein n=1 Tax=Coniochaeta ligniaria NRRL 30616 TaxID=1408157 RepID=A0A1J7IX01_9PEZI|nr:hypothetical protein CONLIGDRAFT_242776 [Coniochaeta ligniaria NRRL 30616]
MPGSAPPTMPSQRSFFLTNFFTALRQQTSPSITAAAAAAASSQQPNKYQPTPSSSAQQQGPSSSSSPSSPPPGPSSSASSRMQMTSPRGPAGAVPIPTTHGGRRRGSDSSSEGFRDVLGADKWYIGGRTAGGEEKFFKLGVVRRVRSGDRLSLDRLSL